MKKNFIVLAAAMCVVALNAGAQEIAIGAKGGLTIPKITPGGNKTPLSEGYSSRQAAGAGAFVEFKFTPTFSLQVGLEYSGQGGQKDGSQAIPSGQFIAGLQGGLQDGFTQMVSQVAAASPTGAQQLQTFGQTMNAAFAGMQGQMPDYLYADYKSVAKFDYLMLPVQAKFGWNLSPTSPWRVYVQAGIFGSYLLDAKRQMSGSSLVYMDKNQTTTLGQAFQSQVAPTLATAAAQVTDPVASQALGTFMGTLAGKMGEETDFDGTQDIYDDLKKFNVGIIGAAGISYNFQRNSIFIEGGGNYGFIKIQKEDVNGQNRIGCGSLMLGYSYTLGRK